MFDGQNYIWLFLAKALEVQVLDVLPERHLPRLLVVVVQPAELPGVHSQLASHLDLGVRQVVALTRIEQGLVRLIAIIEERSGAGGDDENIYLLPDPLLVPLTGNLSDWPKKLGGPGNWLRFTVNRKVQDGLVRQ